MEKTLNICTLVLYDDEDPPEFNFFDTEYEDVGDKLQLPCHYLCVFSRFLKKEDEGIALENKFLSLFHIFSRYESEVRMKKKLIEKYFDSLSKSDMFGKYNHYTLNKNKDFVLKLAKKEGIEIEY